MDINKAIRYVTEDKQWISKLIIAALMTFLGFLIIPAFILQGYLIKIIRQVMNGQWDGLPEWEDYGELMRDGFFVTVAQIVYTLPFIILVLIVSLGMGGLASISDGSDAMAALASGVGLLMVCLTLLFAIALLFLTPAILIQYAIKDDFGALFRFGEVIDIIRNNMADILIAFLVSIVAAFVISLVIGVLSLIPCLGWIAAVVISLAVGPYISFITAHLYGQIAAKVLGNKAGGSLSGLA